MIQRCCCQFEQIPNLIFCKYFFFFLGGGGFLFIILVRFFTEDHSLFLIAKLNKVPPLPPPPRPRCSAENRTVELHSSMQARCYATLEFIDVLSPFMLCRQQDRRYPQEKYSNGRSPTLFLLSSHKPPTPPLQLIQQQLHPPPFSLILTFLCRVQSRYMFAYSRYQII